MKENGMNKLIKLLNEYKIYTDHKKSRMSEYVWANVGDDIVMSSYVGTTKDKTLEIISKKFEFIKRLVDNDKIDFEKNKLQVLKDIDIRGEVFYDYTLFDKADGVIMLLSIEDNPIEFLISILKSNGRTTK